MRFSESEPCTCEKMTFLLFLCGPWGHSETRMKSKTGHILCKQGLLVLNSKTKEIYGDNGLDGRTANGVTQNGLTIYTVCL